MRRACAARRTARGRIESAEIRKGVTYQTVVGSTAKGRLLVVAYGGSLPSTCEAGRTPCREEVLQMTATRRWTDPFDDMSDEEFDAHVDALFSARPRTVGVSLRVPHDLLER